ncbi:MAG: CynX/NimT family MFS transporter [Rhodospirillaceae bacterium]
MTPSDPTPARTRWGVVALLVGVGIVAAFQMGKAAGALPQLRADLGLDLVEAGWLVSIFSLIGASAGMLAGSIADRFGRREVLLVAILLLMLGSYGTDDAVTLLIGRVIEGCGFVAIVAVSPALVVSATAPADRGLALAIWTVYLPVGLATMIVGAPPFMAEVGGWRDLWHANGLLAGAMLAAAALGTRGLGAQPAGAQPAPWASIRTVVMRPRSFLVAVPFACYSLNFLAVSAFLPTFLIERRGATPAEAGALVAAAILCNALGNLVAGAMMRRAVPPWAVTAIGCAAMGVTSLGIFPEVLPGALRQACAMAFLFFGGFVAPSVLASAARHAPSPALVGTSMGLTMQLVSTGHLLGPPALAAVVAVSGSWEAAALLTSALCTTGVIAALALRRLEARTRP